MSIDQANIKQEDLLKAITKDVLKDVAKEKLIDGLSYTWDKGAQGVKAAKEGYGRLKDNLQVKLLKRKEAKRIKQETKEKQQMLKDYIEADAQYYRDVAGMSRKQARKQAEQELAKDIEKSGMTPEEWVNDRYKTIVEIRQDDLKREEEKKQAAKPYHEKVMDKTREAGEKELNRIVDDFSNKLDRERYDKKHGLVERDSSIPSSDSERPMYPFFISGSIEPIRVKKVVQVKEVKVPQEKAAEAIPTPIPSEPKKIETIPKPKRKTTKRKQTRKSKTASPNKKKIIIKEPIP